MGPNRLSDALSPRLSIFPTTCSPLSAQNEAHRIRNIVLVHGAWARRFDFSDYATIVRRSVPRAPSLPHDSRPPRITRKSDGPRVPNRTMVAKFDHVLLCWFRN